VREALLRAIVESPGDLTRRAVYADWLEEYGSGVDLDLAEYIRVGLKKLALPRGDWCGHPISECWRDNPLCRWHLMDQRQWTLACHVRHWDRHLALIDRWDEYGGFIGAVTMSAPRFHVVPDDVITRLFLEHPVRSVELARWTLLGIDQRSIVKADLDRNLRPGVFRFLRGRERGARNVVRYKNARLATRLLNQAVLDYCRDLAGLPTFPQEAP
jgi:uncharacterized protein (TIGR02996 family)